MVEPKPLKVFFNFRSPYCYLASKRMFQLFDDFHVVMDWKPFGGWDGRSPPERAKKKIPLVRQDVGRWCARLGIPFNPPPPTTDPTLAGIGSLYAEENGLLREYIVEVMRREWAEGGDIGDPGILREAAERAGLDGKAFESALGDPTYQEKLKANAAEAEEIGVFGVPTFVIDEDIFWGNDRIDFVAEHLTALRLARL